MKKIPLWKTQFPRLRAGTFIEAPQTPMKTTTLNAISPPSGGDFH